MDNTEEGKIGSQEGNQSLADEEESVKQNEEFAQELQEEVVADSDICPLLIPS